MNRTLRRWTLGIGPLVFLTWCATVALAQSAADPSPQQPSPGDLHLKQSRVYIHVGKTGLGHDHAVVGMLQGGKLNLDSRQDAGTLVFDMRTFSADGDAARKYIGLPGSTDAGTRKQVDANMRGADVLNVARYPTAAFTIKSSTPLKDKSRRGLRQYQLTGDFTLHGVTRPIQVIADAEEKNGWTHLRGGFTILQSQFGIKPFTKAFGAVGVADKLTIWGDLWIATGQVATARSETATGRQRPSR